MKVGLVRHFKVNHKLPKKFLVTAKEVKQWLEEYETAEIEAGDVDLGGVGWKSCFASDMSRAVKTAEKIYSGNIIQLKELREHQPDVFIKSRVKLPFIVWTILVRIKLFISQKSTADFQKHISTVLDDILKQVNENVLIVSHGFVMIFMRKELLKRGFKGHKFRNPANGKLYVYEK